MYHSVRARSAHHLVSFPSGPFGVPILAAMLTAHASKIRVGALPCSRARRRHVHVRCARPVYPPIIISTWLLTDGSDPSSSYSTYGMCVHVHAPCAGALRTGAFLRSRPLCVRLTCVIVLRHGRVLCVPSYYMIGGLVPIETVGIESYIHRASGSRQQRQRARQHWQRAYWLVV